MKIGLDLITWPGNGWAFQIELDLELIGSLDVLMKRGMSCGVHSKKAGEHGKSPVQVNRTMLEWLYLNPDHDIADCPISYPL